MRSQCFDNDDAYGDQDDWDPGAWEELFASGRRDSEGERIEYERNQRVGSANGNIYWT